MEQDKDNQGQGQGGDGQDKARNEGWRGDNPEFRGRENAHTEAFDEDADLPALNRKRNAKFITGAGYAFLGLLALAAVLAVTRTPDKPVVRADDKTVSNRLPALIVPTPPEPPPAMIVPKPEPVAEHEEDDIWKRKMGGGLVAGSSGGNTGRDSRNVSPQQLENERIALLMRQNGGGTGYVGPDGNPVEGSGGPGSYGGMGGGAAGASAAGRGAGSGLGQKLKPTVTEAVSATVLPRRDYLLAKGTTLDCALETAIDSSVPGLTTCRVTRDIYSDNGRVLLLDRGTQLVGEYAGNLGRGQARMFLLWTRAKTPAGVVVNLDSPSTDSLGRSGISGYVDNHFWERFGAAILTSFIKDTVGTVINNRTQKLGTNSGGVMNIYSGTVEAGEQVVSSMLKEQANIPSTLHVNQGAHIQVLVARDLDFSDVYALRVAQ